jgi:hypothetical protein
VGDDAAVVRCVVAGKQYTLPPLLLELPAPETPTGLYARVLDPMALDDLGFERDEPACASLLPPTELELSDAKAQLPKLRQIRAEVSEDPRVQDVCACESARKLQRQHLLPGCVGLAYQAQCSASEDSVGKVQRALGPLEKALGDTKIPLVHWRLAGPTDRPEYFVKHHSSLLSRHSGGSEVYLQASKIPERLNHVLVRSLMEEEGVQAVIRQDSGRALLVVRVLSGALILDHFAYPPVSEDIAPLLPHLDNAQVDRYRAMLALPQVERRLGLDPKQGSLTELDRDGLERVDMGLIMASALGKRYDQDAETRDLPLLIFDRASSQVPFGFEGERVVARLQLTEEGKTWLGALGSDSLPGALASLPASENTPSFSAAAQDTGFVSRGRASDYFWFAGTHVFIDIVRAIENANPGSLLGTGTAWELTLPSGPLPGDFKNTPKDLQRLRERLSKRAHQLTVNVDSQAGAVDVTLSPR